MVLTFSRPYRAPISSRAEKYSSRTLMSLAGSVLSASSVEPWIFANRMVADRVYLGCTLPVRFSSSAIGAGKTLRSSSSARAFSSRLIQLPDDPAVLDQLPAELQLRQHLVRPNRRSDSLCSKE